MEGAEHEVAGGAEETMNRSTARGTARVLKSMLLIRYSSTKQRLSANPLTRFQSRPAVDVETAHFVE